MKKIHLLLFLVLALVIIIYANSNIHFSEQKATVTAPAFMSQDEAVNPGVTLTMEGETHTLEQKDLNPQTDLDFENDDLKFAIYTNEGRVSVNFNLTKTGILGKGPVVYSIPEANQKEIKVDLNFFNQDRESSRMNKRIIFRKGEIQIEKLTKNQLVFTFKGEGSGMTERGDSFPIEGSVNMTY
ncbi:hypothetical protein [Algoriphagus winogradskyi]|uniref:Auto-transporter adhesin head GIN domain-containing protein n=1 Tax=Algoriphagus winogradskyi TaxID=237017 RepID=A0ABY1PEU5_9BACT|nr:hypothetical protein [Algoriphagus winogradskyi]SMP31869.1 hypothetical protein SAMN06265367_107226 [Algoriphagus winogradskyi]